MEGKSDFLVVSVSVRGVLKRRRATRINIVARRYLYSLLISY